MWESQRHELPFNLAFARAEEIRLSLSKRNSQSFSPFESQGDMGISLSQP